jgi:hypothetical protein
LPAAPSKGFIFCFRKRFIILAKIKPDAVAIENATAPRKNMPSALVVSSSMIGGWITGINAM